MNRIFLVGGMSLFSVFAFSQEMKVSNQREMVAAQGQKETPVSENNTEGTLILQPVERTMNSAGQPDLKGSEMNLTNPSGQVTISPMERVTSTGNPASSMEEKPNTSTRKP